MCRFFHKYKNTQEELEIYSVLKYWRDLVIPSLMALILLQSVFLSSCSLYLMTMKAVYGN